MRRILTFMLPVYKSKDNSEAFIPLHATLLNSNTANIIVGMHAEQDKEHTNMYNFTGLRIYYKKEHYND